MIRLYQTIKHVFSILVSAMERCLSCSTASLVFSDLWTGELDLVNVQLDTLGGTSDLLAEALSPRQPHLPTHHSVDYTTTDCNGTQENCLP